MKTSELPEILPNRAVWDVHYKRDRAAQEYPDENLVRLLKSRPEDRSNCAALDLGCGSGRHIALMRDCGFGHIHATDVSETALEFCRRRFGFALFHPLSARMLKRNRFHLPLSDELLDTIVAWGVLHYNPPELMESVLKEVVRLLKPGGRFLGTLRSTRDTHFKSNPDMTGATARLFDKEEARSLLLDHFATVKLGFVERQPVGSKFRVSHWVFDASN